MQTSFSRKRRYWGAKRSWSASGPSDCRALELIVWSQMCRLSAQTRVTPSVHLRYASLVECYASLLPMEFSALHTTNALEKQPEMCAHLGRRSGRRWFHGIQAARNPFPVASEQ